MDPNSDHHQNLVDCFSSQGLPVRKIS